jgi:UDP-glucose:(heptosyl)LPS alpha-1,3-glucosyltransferase
MSAVERVAVVQRDVNLSGSLERDAFLLVRELVALGLDVHVYCNPQTRTDRLDGATFHDVRPLVRSASRAGRALELASFAAAATRALRDDRSRRPYDVVDVNGVAAWDQDVVRVHEVVAAAQRRWPQEAGHGHRAARARAAAAPVLRPQLAAARRIQRLQFRPGAYAGALAVSEQVRDDLVETFGVPAERIAVVPLAVDLAPVARDARERIREGLAVGRDDPLLLFVGHAFRRKGLPEAIDALAGLPPAAHLVVVGEGRNGERREAAGRAEAAGIAAHVHFVGATEDVAPYYAAADVFVLPTSHDAWGVPVIEAMWAGLPVVTTRAAGSASELERSGAGIVVDSRVAAELRDALAALLGDPARLARMGEDGRRAAARYTARHRAELTLDAYERFAAAGRTRRRPPAAETRRIASFPAALAMNPYQRLLYDHLGAEGFELEPQARFALRWLIAARGRVDVLHFHWPEGLYSLGRGPAWLRPAGSWAKLGLFAVRLGAARALGYRIAWTVHQVYPHGSRGWGRDRLASLVLSRAAHVLLAHDETTRGRAAAALGRRAASRVALVQHGSYVGVYPPGRSRAEVRRRLGLADDTFVFLSFGELRAHKCWRFVIRAYRATTRADTALVVAGLARSEELQRALRTEVGDDPRIRLLLDYVADEEVAELFGAADAAVVARDDGGTSGSLVLPLSLGVPVIAADCPAYRSLTGGEASGWLFRPGDESSLCEALEQAAANTDEARRRGSAALERARRLRWSDAAAQTARLLREAGA